MCVIRGLCCGISLVVTTNLFNAEVLLQLMFEFGSNSPVFSVEVVVPEGLNCCVSGVLVLSQRLLRVE